MGLKRPSGTPVPSSCLRSPPPGITGGFTSTLRPKLWNPVSSEKRMGFKNWPRFRGCTPNPTPLHAFAQFLGCDPPPSPNTCMNLTWYGVCDALLHPHPCLRTCIPFKHFSLGPRVLKMGVPPPPTLGPALPTIRSHLYCCSYAMKPDGRRANPIGIASAN